MKVKLKELLTKLKENPVNSFEYHDKKKKFKKTYPEIHGDVINTLYFLRQFRLKRNERIGVLGGNLYEWVLLDIASIMAGYVLVAFPESAFGTGEVPLENIPARYNLKLLFLGEDHREKFKHKDDRRVFSLNAFTREFSSLPKPSSAELNLEPFEQDDIFTIIFTSGTTGFPKGLEMKTKGAEDFIDNLSDRFTPYSQDKIIVFLPLYIATSRLFIYGAILLGYNIVMTSPDNFIKVLRTAKPTILQGVPNLFKGVYDSFYQNIRASVFKYLIFKLFLLLKKIVSRRIKEKLQHILFKEFKNFWGGKMRIMVTGAAPISEKVLKFYNEIVGVPLYEAYGTNETGTIATNFPGSFRIGSVGKPFANKEVLIDEDGLIFIKGDYCWASRYLDEPPEVNRQIFRTDGYIATGDIGCFDADGYLYLKGRSKDVMILDNGEKIHPTFIENKLNNSFLIKQSIAFGDKRPFIVCILVKGDDDVPDRQLQEEIDKINRTLPESFQIKNFFAAQEPFTISNKLLNPNMKLNRSLIFQKYQKEIKNLYN